MITIESLCKFRQYIHKSNPDSSLDKYIMQSKEQSEKRGDIEFKEGMDYITTSLFRWSKDYPSGTSHFNQARIRCPP